MDEVEEQRPEAGSGRVPPWQAPPTPPGSATFGPAIPLTPEHEMPASGRSGYRPAVAGSPESVHRNRRRVIRVVAVLVGTLIFTFVLAVVLLHQPHPVGTEVDALAGTGNWVHYRDPAGAFELDFPADPGTSDEEIGDGYRAVEISTRVLRDTFTLERVDFDDGATGGVVVEQWLDEMPSRAATSTGARLLSSERTTHAGLPGIEYVLVRSDSTTRVTALMAGRRMFRFSVTAPTDPGAGFDRFVGSFVPIDPTTGQPVTTGR